MAARKPPLRAVKADEKPAAAAKPMTVAQAARSGDRRLLLVTTLDRVAKAIDDPTTPPRDLAALTRRLELIAKEIEAIDSRDGEDEIGEAAVVPDDEFDAEAL